MKITRDLYHENLPETIALKIIKNKNSLKTSRCQSTKSYYKTHTKNTN